MKSCGATLIENLWSASEKLQANILLQTVIVSIRKANESLQSCFLVKFKSMVTKRFFKSTLKNIKLRKKIKKSILESSKQSSNQTINSKDAAPQKGIYLDEINLLFRLRITISDSDS